MSRSARPRFDRRELRAASPQVLADLARLTHDIDGHFRAAAEQIALLYMSADAHQLGSLTRSLDEPMRRTAEAERAFANLLQELRACADSRE